MNELLYLLRSYVLPRPGILPSRFGFGSFYLGMIWILASFRGRARSAIFGFEDVFEERHDERVSCEATSGGAGLQSPREGD